MVLSETMGNETSEEKKAKKERKEVIGQLVKFNYDKTEILNAMRAVNQPNDVWEVLKYLEEKKEKEYNKTMQENINEIDFAEEKRQKREDQQASREWNTNEDNLTLLKKYSKLTKNELIEICKERNVSSDGTTNEMIARLLKANEYQISKPTEVTKKKKDDK